MMIEKNSNFDKQSRESIVNFIKRSSIYIENFGQVITGQNLNSQKIQCKEKKKLNVHGEKYEFQQLITKEKRKFHETILENSREVLAK